MTSLPLRTVGGAAGTSMRRTLSRPMASTMPVSADRVRARASTLESSAATLPGIAPTISAKRTGSTSAGVHRTAYDALSERDEPLRRRRWRSKGTIAPRAASSNGPQRDLAQPPEAGADVGAHLSGTGGHQPAEDLADRGRHRLGLAAPRYRHARVRGPRRRGGFGVRQQGGDLVGGGRLAVGAAGPRHHPAGLPGELQADHAGDGGLGLLAGRRFPGRALAAGAASSAQVPAPAARAVRR